MVLLVPVSMVKRTANRHFPSPIRNVNLGWSSINFYAFSRPHMQVLRWLETNNANLLIPDMKELFDTDRVNYYGVCASLRCQNLTLKMAYAILL